MNFDCIIANPPYGKIGVDITKNVIEQNPDSNYAMLGTRSMFKPFYADTLACAFVQIGHYELGSNKKLDWGVEQAILLATNGWTEVVDNRKKKGDNKVGVGSIKIYNGAFADYRTSHLVGIGESGNNICGYSHLRSAHLVGAPACLDRAAWNHGTRNAHLVGVSAFIDRAAWNQRARNATVVQATDTKPTDVKLRSGYIYVSFETFEEACECAIDIISWTDPTDSHYRCVKWGFVCGLIPHCFRKTK